MQLSKIEGLISCKPETGDKFKKDLDFIQKQFDEAVSTFSSSGSGDSFQANLLEGYLHLLSGVRDRVQDEVKTYLTDAEAFHLLAAKTKLNVIDILQSKKVAAADPKEFNNILDINFNILGLTVKDLKMKALEHFTRIAPPSLDRKVIQVFIDEVAGGYQINPYHNFTHGFGVAQVFYYMWSISPNLQKILDSDAMYIGCIAGLGHDVGHRGKNNMFYSNTNHYFSKLSLNKSVLEHYHAFKTIQILQNKANMLSSYDKAVRSSSPRPRTHTAKGSSKPSWRPTWPSTTQASRR